MEELNLRLRELRQSQTAVRDHIENLEFKQNQKDDLEGIEDEFDLLENTPVGLKILCARYSKSNHIRHYEAIYSTNTEISCKLRTQKFPIYASLCQFI